MDALADVFEMCRVRATVFSRAWLEAPWGVEARDMAHGIFHGVVRGSCWVIPGEGPGQELRAGDVVFLPHGLTHVMCDRLGSPVRPIFEVSEPGIEGRPGRLVIEGEGDQTELICGKVTFDRDHPLLTALPEVLVSRPGEGRLGSRSRTLGLITEELSAHETGAEVAVSRLTEVLLVQALRDWLAESSGVTGWLRGLTDARVARALGHIHRHPERSWSVEDLARHAGMSRSGFSATFHELVGEAPRRYLTRCRMHLAARALERRADSLAHIAQEVGYASEFSFSRAFKAATGESPSRYRSRLQGSRV